MEFHIDTIDLVIILIAIILLTRNIRKSIKVLDIIDNKDRPLDLVILCPYCFTRHVDNPDPSLGWTNPPHKTHLCRSADGGCGKTFRPTVFYTNGV